MSISNVVRMIEENDVRFVDLRFTDTKGKQHHFTVPAAVVLDDPEEEDDGDRYVAVSE